MSLITVLLVTSFLICFARQRTFVLALEISFLNQRGNLVFWVSIFNRWKNTCPWELREESSVLLSWLALVSSSLNCVGRLPFVLRCYCAIVCKDLIRLLDLCNLTRLSCRSLDLLGVNSYQSSCCYWVVVLMLFLMCLGLILPVEIICVHLALSAKLHSILISILYRAIYEWFKCVRGLRLIFNLVKSCGYSISALFQYRNRNHCWVFLAQRDWSWALLLRELF